MNALRLQTEPDERGDVRIWVFVDGEKRFQVGIECLEDCFLTRGPVVSDPYLKNCLLKSASEKIIDYGFCVEDCCASTVASIEFSPQEVRWTGVRLSTAEPDSAQASYVFEREAYDIEVERCVAFLARHYQRLYTELRYPPKAEPCAAPNGGTAARLGNSDVTGGRHR